MLIDSHLHITPHFKAKDIIRYMDTNRIEKAWLLSWEEEKPAIPCLYWHYSAEMILEACHQYPERFVPFYAPDPTSADLESKINFFKENKFNGFAELKVSIDFSSDVLEKYLDIVKATKPLLLFHSENTRVYYNYNRKSHADKLLNLAFNGNNKYLFTPIAEKFDFYKKKALQFPGYLSDLAYLETLLAKYPEIRFIGHGPLFWNSFSLEQSKTRINKGKVKTEGLIWSLMEKYPNLHCDTSGLYAFSNLKRDSKASKRFIEAFYNKILFGTDNCKQDFIGFLNSLGVEKNKMEQVFYKNANQLI